MNTIGERIVFLREKRGISQKELARQLGITAASLSRYENNLYDPKSTIITNLSQILNTSTDYLLGITSDYRVSTNSDQVSENDLRIWELYRSLSQEDKLRIEERILTLFELHEKKQSCDSKKQKFMRKE